MAARAVERGDPVTVEGLSRGWGRSYGSTQRLVRHAVALGWLEPSTLVPTPAGLEAIGRI
jgi:hypothetical protein